MKDHLTDGELRAALDGELDAGWVARSAPTTQPLAYDS